MNNLGHNPDGKTKAFLEKHRGFILKIRNWGGKTFTFV